MPKISEHPIPADVLELLRRPNPAVMATVAKDGRPVTVATWYLVEDGPAGPRVLLGLDASRARLEHLRRDGRVSLTALAEGDWYTHVSVQGHVVGVVDDEGLAGIDEISRHYTGSDYANRTSPRVLVRVELDRWHGWGAAAQQD